jgi:hypothetical protein
MAWGVQVPVGRAGMEACTEDAGALAAVSGRSGREGCAVSTDFQGVVQFGFSSVQCLPGLTGGGVHVGKSVDRGVGVACARRTTIADANRQYSAPSGTLVVDACIPGWHTSPKQKPESKGRLNRYMPTYQRGPFIIVAAMN